MITIQHIDAIASQFTGKATTVQCLPDSSPDWQDGTAGYVLLANGQTVPIVYLPKSTCNRLEHLDTGNEIIVDDMLVFTHELYHVEGWQNECDTEKLALQNEWQVLKLFKLAKWRAQAILGGAKFADQNFDPEYHVGCTDLSSIV